MIEVEKKFKAEKNELARLIAGAHFLREDKHTDVYYDTADYALTKRDIWLRMRSGKFELKYPIGAADAVHDVTVYDEIENDAAIAAKLGMPTDKSLQDVLVSLGYVPFATITTTRAKYEKDGFHIDIDEADFGYSILEIELMVSDKNEVDSAGGHILDFAAKNGISVSEKQVRGKVREYIRLNNPRQARILEEAWGIAL
jgi:predicted adenylyl cyclase CyaB